MNERKISEGPREEVKAALKAHDVVTAADKAIQGLKEDGGGKIKVKITQLRKLLTAVTAIKNEIDVYKLDKMLAEKKLPEKMDEDLASKVAFLKVKAAYQAGRNNDNNDVKDFIVKTDIITQIGFIGNDIKKFERFASYIEALVAYHKFYSSTEGIDNGTVHIARQAQDNGYYDSLDRPAHRRHG